jgi:hypothetical protein
MATERSDLRGGARTRAGALGLVFALLASACAARPRAAAAPPAAVTAQAADESAAPVDDTEDATPADEDAESPEADEGTAVAGPCPAEMALVALAGPTPARFCVDRYEASLVEVLADGTERPFPHYLPVDGRAVRAVSAPHVFPQGYISEVQAEDACAASNKRLCRFDEWRSACMGPARTTFPYGAARRPGVCNDNGKSAVIAVFGAKAVAASTPAAAPAPVAASGKHAHAAPAAKGRPPVTRPRATASKASTKPASAKASAASAKASNKRKGVRTQGKKSARPASVDPGVWARLNDPALGQVEGALGKTGERAECANDFGVFDMMGNLHEWVATDPALAHGTFAGGYYLDTTLNGDGCLYKTQAHAHEYHDYSTGFRCCADASATTP